MKKLHLYLFIILLLAFFSQCKQNKNTTKEAKSDKGVDTVLQEYFFPEELVYNQSINNVLVDKFYPIGWSKDGKFAYIVEPADEAVGAYFFRIVVKDLVNNKILWDWENDIEKEKYREEIWKNHYDLFKRKLNQYGIIQQKNFTLKDLYFRYNHQDYILKLNLTTKKDPDLFLDVITKYTVIIDAPSKGSKIVYTQELSPYDFILNALIKGHFKSPYEDRIAILVATERKGYEGPPNVISFTLVGTNLDVGFK